ncbi:MAG TPA: hypothetical protein VJP89_06600 [Pyrinomonadaceae bacterium]|nr:hypothetical protein [Pyrinomonadaceae bacterium]
MNVANVNNHKLWVTIVVLAHLVVNLLHGNAHTSLGVGLSSWQTVYVLSVILLAPLLALVLSFTRYLRAALWLLLLSMLGSLIFGFLYHYIIISSDHVAHLPAGDARGLFRTTALLLLVTEALGVVVAAMAIHKKAQD